MSLVTFLAKCNDRQHETDLWTVEDLRSIAGVEKALSIGVNFQGQEYCIVVNSKVRSSKDIPKILAKIKRQPHITAVTQLA